MRQTRGRIRAGVKLRATKAVSLATKHYVGGSRKLHQLRNPIYHEGQEGAQRKSILEILRVTSCLPIDRSTEAL